METTKIIKEAGTAIGTLGIIGGFITIFIEGLIGIEYILFSASFWVMCNWLSEILENSKRQTSLLNEITNKLDEMKNTIEK